MPGIQVAFDAADPHALAAFWAALLHYRVEDHSALVDQLVAAGQMPESDRVVHDGRSAFADVATAVDPTGVGPRLFFQRVPEPKTAKNRVHLDVPAGDDVDAEVARALALGARELWVTSDRGPVTHTLADPEGNEFCLH